MKNTGLKARQRQINLETKKEERRTADLNMIKIEQLELQARERQIQMKKALAFEYEQSIRETNQRQLQDAMNKAEIDKRQLDIGTKLSMLDGEKENQRKKLEKEYFDSNFNNHNLS